MARFSMSMEIPNQALVLVLFYIMYMEIHYMLRCMREADDAVAFVQQYKFPDMHSELQTDAATGDNHADQEDDKASESSFAFAAAPLPDQRSPQDIELVALGCPKAS